MLFPGSGLFNRGKPWIVSAEIVETSRLFARIAANIDESWLEPLGKPFCKYHYFEPHWEKKRGEVVAFEQVTLFGLVIIPQRRISFGKIDPGEAADIFIRSALVEGDVRHLGFVAHNRALIDDVRDMENRIRKRELLVNEEDMVLFYKERLPEVFDIRTLKKRIKNQGDDLFLRMTRETLLKMNPDEDVLALFPEKVKLGNRIFPCDYAFEPEKHHDGVTVKIPETLASGVPQQSVDRLVPGLYREKIAALIKGLPKSYRKQLMPIAANVDIIVTEMTQTDSALITDLGAFIHKRFTVDIPATAWSEEKLPDYLKMRIAIVDSKGREIKAGRDASILNRILPEAGDDAHEEGADPFKAAKCAFERQNITRWDFGDLKDTMVLTGRKDRRQIMFPGLCAVDERIDLKLFIHKDAAMKAHEKAVGILFCLQFAKDLSALKKDFRIIKTIREKTGCFGGVEKVKTMLFDHVVRTLFQKNIRSCREFSSHGDAVGPLIFSTGQHILQTTIAILMVFHEARTGMLKTNTKPGTAIAPVFEDLWEDLERLVPEKFLLLYDEHRLAHL